MIESREAQPVSDGMGEPERTIKVLLRRLRHLRARVHDRRAHGLDTSYDEVEAGALLKAIRVLSGKEDRHGKRL